MIRFPKIPATPRARRDFVVREAIFILHVKKHGRKHAAAAAGGRGDDGAVRGVLLGGGKGVGADKLEFAHLRNVEKVRPLIKELRLPGDVQTAGENAGSRSGRPESPCAWCSRWF